jgi:hypothetical protein
MMSGVPLETYWAFNKLWGNKFFYKLHLVGISTESYYDARIHEYQIYELLTVNFCLIPLVWVTHLPQISSKGSVGYKLSSHQKKTRFMSIVKHNCSHIRHVLNLIFRENIRTNISIKFSSFLSHIQEVQGSDLFLNHNNFKFLLKRWTDCEACIYRRIWYMGVVQGGV